MRRRGAEAHALLLALLAAGAGAGSGTGLTFFTQLFVPACTPLSEPPPGGYLRWSSPATWVLLQQRPKGGVIPGVGGGAGANVTIPCGRAVLLDVLSLDLTHLDIRGLLRVEDASLATRNYLVTASFISVEGQMYIGRAKQHFQSKITFSMKPNPQNRLPLIVNGLALPTKTSKVPVPTEANVGHKAFAVVGGQLAFYGMPRGPSTLSWVRLNANAEVNDTKIQVDKRVWGSWPVGSSIAIASTDYEPEKAEEAIILGFSRAPNGNDIIYLDRPLQFNHWGDPQGLPDGFGKYLDQRAEVALLSRNIHITTTNESDAYRLEGGHFIVHQTRTRQVLYGVEFSQLGQQGTLGRYSLHFHVCGDTRGKSTVTKNAIHHSRQRCIVVHATHNLTLDSNVAYYTFGHCFIVEEGGEQDNLFINNLGMQTMKVENVIPGGETDRKGPATFWITNMYNHFINNVAAGSQSSGVWTEMHGHVRGMSKFIPELKDILPVFTSGGTISGFTLHSNWEFGFRAYPSGIRPREDYNATAAQEYGPREVPLVNLTLSNLNIYKHRKRGLFFQKTGNVLVTRSTFADNNIGIFIQTNTAGVIQNNRFVGWSRNTGTPLAPEICARRFGDFKCAPIQGCQFPPTDPKNIRNINWQNWQQPQFGILISGLLWMSIASPNSQILNNRFSQYDPSCGRTVAAVGVGLSLETNWWDTAVGLSGMKLDNVTPPVWLPVDANTFDPYWKPWVAGESLSKDLAIHDRDGTTIGGKQGYLLANYSFLLPPKPTTPKQRWPCRTLPSGNGYHCTGTCYRTVRIQFYEDGFVPYPKEKGVRFPKKKRGDFTWMKITRVSDQQTRDMYGNLDIYYSNGGVLNQRLFYFTLLAGQTYDVHFVQGKNRAFWPSSVDIFYADGYGQDRQCSGPPIKLRFFAKGSTRQWAVEDNPLGFYSSCPGVRFNDLFKRWPYMYHYTCIKGKRVLLLRLNSNLLPRQRITLISSNDRVASCSRSPPLCGAVPSGDVWNYNDAGLDLSQAPGSLGFQDPRFNKRSFVQGQALFGAIRGDGPDVQTRTKPSGKQLNATGNGKLVRTTIYFRRVFRLTWMKCYGGMYIDYYPIHGLLVWLNGIELFRFSLPKGPINGSTFATDESKYDPVPKLVRSPLLKIPAVDKGPAKDGSPYLQYGINLLAYELHVHNERDSNYYFDSRISLLWRC